MYVASATPSTTLNLGIGDEIGWHYGNCLAALHLPHFTNISRPFQRLLGFSTLNRTNGLPLPSMEAVEQERHVFVWCNIVLVPVHPRTTLCGTWTACLAGTSTTCFRDEYVLA